MKIHKRNTNEHEKRDNHYSCDADPLNTTVTNKRHINQTKKNKQRKVRIEAKFQILEFNRYLHNATSNKSKIYILPKSTGHCLQNRLYSVSQSLLK